MCKFYFNDCLPQDKSRHEVLSCLKRALPEYKTIREKFHDDVDGIVTSRMPGNIVLNADGFTLKNCIEGLVDRDLRRYAFAVFGKYPVEEHFLAQNEDDLLENKYYIAIGGIEYDALNAMLVGGNGGILFSLALHDDLRKDVISIGDKNGEKYFVFNLYGETENTACIEREIQGLIADQLGNFELLLLEIGACSYTEQFQTAFNRLSGSIQKAIIKHFAKARSREGPTAFYADGVLIKDVTPSTQNDIRLSELRIFDPVAYRVYFYEAKDTVYLALLEKKPTGKVQSGQIRTAAEIVRRMAVR
jgi:hypothetical protein